jgi:hypothetical protein
MSSSNRPTVNGDGVEDPNLYEKLCNELRDSAEASPFESEDPYSYCLPDLLPQTEGEVKSAVGSRRPHAKAPN